MITGIQTISLPVSDQSRARAFYVDVLKFTVKQDLPTPFGANWLTVMPPGSQTAFLLCSWLDMKPGSFRGMLLESTDLSGDAQHLRNAGVEVTGPLDTPWGQQVKFSDPDGNEFVLVKATR